MAAAVEFTRPATAPLWTLGTALVRAREEAGMSQKELADALAEKLGETVSRQRISKWERNIGEPGWSAFHHIARITGARWLLDLKIAGFSLSAVPLTDAQQMELDLWYEERRRPTLVGASRF